MFHFRSEDVDWQSFQCGVPCYKVGMYLLSFQLLSSLELSNTQVYKPSIRALLGTAARFCEVVFLKLRTNPNGTALNLRKFQVIRRGAQAMSLVARSSHCPPTSHPLALRSSARCSRLVLSLLHSVRSWVSLFCTVFAIGSPSSA